jgi:hypothetical protein
MTSRTSTQQGCLFALIFDLLAVVVVIGITLLQATAAYDGSCIRWDAALPGETCTLAQFLVQAIVVYLLVGLFRYWWLALLLLLLPALLGFLWGRRRARQRA